MTTLEIILSILLYLSFGMWLCHKREWYSNQAVDNGEAFFINALACVFMPLNLIIIIFKEFILREWEN